MPRTRRGPKDAQQEGFTLEDNCVHTASTPCLAHHRTVFMHCIHSIHDILIVLIASALYS